MRQIQKFKLERRSSTSIGMEVVAFLVAIGGSIIVSCVLIVTSGSNVGEVFLSIYKGAFGNKNAILETLVQATPLIFTGLAIVVAFKGRIWNIGVEGQFFAGAMMAAWVSMSLNQLPKPLLILLILAGSAAGGAIWGFVPGYLRTRFNANEIIVTVMLNYVILKLLSYLLSTVWKEPGEYYLMTRRFDETTFLPTFFNSRIHLGLFIALLLTIFVYVFLWRTPLGYEIRAIGVNQIASLYKGIKINRTIILAMMLSGAIAGLAGGTELCGLHHRLRLAISPGYGFTAILVALLGRLNPFGTLLASVFFGALINGATGMKIFTDVPVALVKSVQAIVLIFLLIAEAAARYRIRRVIEVE